MAKTGKNGLSDVTTAFGDFKLPGIDLEAAVASQRKNIEALTQANQLMVEGIQAVLRRQAEITHQAMADFSTMFRAFVQPSGSPEDCIAKHVEYSKQAIEKGLSNAKELTDLVTKANTEAFSVINKRLTESLRDGARISQ